MTFTRKAAAKYANESSPRLLTQKRRSSATPHERLTWELATKALARTPGRAGI
jgi:hypothetical protein